MKNGKYTLSAAAFIVTAASVFAFKGNTKFNNQRHVLGKTANGQCTVSTCFTSNQAYVAGEQACHTVMSGRARLLTGGLGEMWTAKNAFGGCTKPTFEWTRTD